MDDVNKIEEFDSTKVTKEEMEGADKEIALAILQQMFNNFERFARDTEAMFHTYKAELARVGCCFSATIRIAGENRAMAMCGEPSEIRDMLRDTAFHMTVKAKRGEG